MARSKDNATAPATASAALAAPSGPAPKVESASPAAPRSPRKRSAAQKHSPEPKRVRTPTHCLRAIRFHADFDIQGVVYTNADDTADRFLNNVRRHLTGEQEAQAPELTELGVVYLLPRRNPDLPGNHSLYPTDPDNNRFWRKVIVRNFLEQGAMPDHQYQELTLDCLRQLRSFFIRFANFPIEEDDFRLEVDMRVSALDTCKFILLPNDSYNSYCRLTHHTFWSTDFTEENVQRFVEDTFDPQDLNGQFATLFPDLAHSIWSRPTDSPFAARLGV